MKKSKRKKIEKSPKISTFEERRIFTQDKHTEKLLIITMQHFVLKSGGHQIEFHEIETGDQILMIRR